MIFEHLLAFLGNFVEFFFFFASHQVFRSRMRDVLLGFRKNKLCGSSNHGQIVTCYTLVFIFNKRSQQNGFQNY